MARYTSNQIGCWSIITRIIQNNKAFVMFLSECESVWALFTTLFFLDLALVFL